MKLLNKTLISTAAALTVLFSGCGDTVSPETSGQETTDNIVTVERGPILGALVMDAANKRAKDIGEGRYDFGGEITYPIEVVGGYIDVDRNGKIDAGEVKNTLVLKASQGKAVTLVSTIAQDKDLRQLVEDNFGLSVSDIASKLPSNNVEVEALSNEIYTLMVDQGFEDLEKLKPEFEAKIDEIKSKVGEYKSDDRTVGEREQELMNGMDNAPKVVESELDEIKNKIQERKDHSENGTNDDITEYVHDVNLSRDQELALKKAYQLQALSVELEADADMKAALEDKISEGKDKFKEFAERFDVNVSEGMENFTAFDENMSIEIAALRTKMQDAEDKQAVRAEIQAYIEDNMDEIIAGLPQMIQLSIKEHEERMDDETDMIDENMDENMDDDMDSDAVSMNTAI